MTTYLGLARRLRRIGATWPSILGYPLVRRLIGENRLRLRDGVRLAAPYGEALHTLLIEIWHDRCYWMPEVPPALSAGHIIDIGAHVGAFAVWAASRWPGAKVICIEPDPVLFSYLRCNLANNDVTGPPPFAAACGGTAGEAALYARGARALNTLYSRDAYGSTFSLRGRVRVITLHEILDELGLGCCPLLKLDCEGAEYDILYAAPRDLLKKVDNIALEYHVGMNDHGPDELAGHLRARGYSVRTLPPRDEEGGYMYATRQDNQ